MRRLVPSLVVGLAGLCGIAPEAAARAAAPGAARSPRANEPRRPNVVVILADDLGYSDIGPYGAEIPTPHLDRLAARGVRFTRFYNAGRCCPSRAALLAGRYAHRVGVGHMTADLGDRAYRGVLDPATPTVAELLRSAGYQTLMVGKWHVGSKPGAWPRRRGFDRFYGLPLGGGVYFPENFATRPDQKLVRDDAVIDVPRDFYVTETLTSEAEVMLDEAARRKAPFFLYFAHVAPHFPLQARAEDVARHRGRYDRGWDELRTLRLARQVELGLFPRSLALPARDGVAAWDAQPASATTDLALRMSVYAAMVDALDRSVGRLMGKLEALGVLDDTVILFLSDNGGSAEGGPGGFDRVAGRAADERGAYPSYGQGWAQLSNTPFRRWKSEPHEGGIASPLIVHWPAGIAPARHGGALRRQVGHVIDLLPTVLDLAGAKAPRGIDGQSLRASFTRDTSRPRTLYWEHEGHRAIRRGDLKLVSSRGKPWVLHDLATDPTELRPLTRPAPIRALAAAWERWARDVGVKAWPVKPPVKPGTAGE